ncbi:MAG TPA: ribosome maturation factor RimM [Caulobacteraceae bacterium]|jgi:16S rRNA processing protein RimM|nr:ribosome maturation factor RimM [Caulobacteraceae bacterium]
MSGGADLGRLLLVGRVGGAFGVGGELRIASFTDPPDALLGYGELRDETGAVALTLASGRLVKGGLVARAAQVETREQAQALRGLALHIRRGQLPAPDDEDEYYLADLVGLAARDLSDAPLGRVKSAQDFGAGTLLEIEPAAGGPSWWAPFTRQAVPEVRIIEGWVRIDPLIAGAP